MTPTGVQYLVFNAFTVAGIVLKSWWDRDNGIWYLWILSPLCSIITIHPEGEVKLPPTGETNRG